MTTAWPFVGRAEEFQLIHEAMAGSTGIVLAGAPGVGKTRLAYEAVTAADPRRYVALWAAATPATTPIPLGALAPLLPAELPATTDRADLLRGAATTLLQRCGNRRLVLGIDDAHLLDETSAALVHQLAHTGRAFVLASLRSRQPAPDPIRALWKDELATRIELQGLSQSETRQVLVEALGGHVDGATNRRLWDIARGNMLLLRELVNAGLDSGALTEIAGVWRWEGPWVLAPGLVELIGARIGGLEPPEQDVLEVLAYGEPLGAELLATLTSQPAVEDVESQQLLWARQDGRRTDVRLAHPLYGEVLRAHCPAHRANAVRSRLADAVEATGARRRDDCLRIATWRLDTSGAVQSGVLTAAARRAFAALDLPLAERLARGAFEAGDLPGGGEVLWRVLFLGQRNAEAEEVMVRLEALPMTDDQRGEYAFGRAYNLFWGLHRISDAYNLLHTTREAIGPGAWRDELDNLDCVFQLLQGRPRQALQCLTQLRARPLGARVDAQTQVAQGMALVHLGALTDAVEVLEKAAEPISQWTEEIPWVAETRRIYRFYPELFAGRLAAAAELADACYQHAVETNWEFALRVSCGAQAHVARLQGRVRTAARWAREGQRIYAHLPVSFFRNYLLGELAHAEALAGDGRAAAAALAEADRRFAPSEGLLQPWIELARPWVAVAAGDRAHGVELALAAAAHARGQDAPGFEAFTLHDAVRLGAAHTVTDRLHELAETVDGDLVAVLAGHAAAAAAGDAEGLDAAAAALAAAGADLLAAEAHAQAAQAHQRVGRAASDRRQRTRAALLLDGCEGARTPLVAGLRAPHLTERERQVAELAAQGLSNEQIADRLVLSSRTVGNHLHHVYGKLGVDGRSGLAALLPLPGRRM